MRCAFQATPQGGKRAPLGRLSWLLLLLHLRSCNGRRCWCRIPFLMNPQGHSFVPFGRQRRPPPIVVPVRIRSDRRETRRRRRRLGKEPRAPHRPDDVRVIPRTMVPVVPEKKGITGRGCHRIGSPRETSGLNLLLIIIPSRLDQLIFFKPHNVRCCCW